MGMCELKFPFKDLIISAIKCLEFVFEWENSLEIRVASFAELVVRELCAFCFLLLQGETDPFICPIKGYQNAWTVRTVFCLRVLHGIRITRTNSFNLT
jgi:hypothetical protein